LGNEVARAVQHAACDRLDYQLLLHQPRAVFGAEAAAQHYFQKSASKLNAWEAARLAVMLPRPRYFEKLPQSVYLSDRADTIMARMNDVALP
jgi:membrane carboxypeptidase/penicillin-binding protein